MSIELFPKLVNLLSFPVVGAAILLIVRGDLAGQVRLFAVQSLVLAVLAIRVATFTDSRELLLVGVALTLIKVLVIPRVMNRAVTKIGLERPCRALCGHGRGRWSCADCWSSSRFT